MSNKVVICMLVCFAFLQGCATYFGIPQSIKTQPPYDTEVGLRYRLLVDCYVVKHKGIAVPVIYPVTVAYYDFPQPAVRENIGTKLINGTIEGIVEKGAVFQVVDVIRKKSVEYNYIMYYVTSVNSSGQEALLNAYPLFTRSGHVPQILQDYGSPLDER